MEALTVDDLDAASDAFDGAVARSHGVDGFCSSTDWIVPAARGLQPGREPWIRRGEHGFVALMHAEHEGGPYLEPLEAMWGLACPVVGGDVAELAAEFVAEKLRVAPRTGLLLCGFERAVPLETVARALASTHGLWLGPTARRWRASLAGGVDGFLGRRSALFRRGVTRARRRAAARGLVFERVHATADTAAAAYERALAVEALSWKSHGGVGILGSTMVDFYRHMVPRLAARGALRLIVARDGDRDVAYILGGVRGGIYRGLQFSFAQGYDDCALGNLCQLEQIADLAAEGARVYDLGTDAEYKRRWAESVYETVTLIARPRQ
jgi:CelD/BcsL family acetyltransferase involved in cellulose biosynthesis